MVNSQNILRDSIFYVKNFLSGQVTDPISSTRLSSEKFIMTSYPRRDTTYPLITIKDINLESISPLGMQSEAMLITISIEVRIWARNTKERDVLADQIYHLLRTNQIGTSGTNQANDLHDFKMISSVNVDEDTIKSKVMTFEYKAVIG